MTRRPPHRAPFRLLLPVLACTAVAALTPCAQSAWWNPWQRKAGPEEPILLGQKVKIQFEGAKSLPESKLRESIDEQIKQIRREGLTRPNADDAAYYLAVFYHQNGYAAAEVSWDIRKDTLLLEVREGNRIALTGVHVQGNQSIPAKSLASLLTSVSTARLRLPENRLPFVLDELQMGASRIVDLYQSEGFLDATVDGPEVAYGADGKSAEVTVTVHEGRQYRFGRLQFQGSLIYPEADIQKALAPVTSKPYTPARLAALQHALQQFYAGRAHFEAVVEASPGVPSGDSAEIPILLSIHAGPTYRFDGAEIEGLVKLQPSWVRSRLALLEGKPFDPAKLAQKQQELLSSGLFDSLKITPVPQLDRTLKLKVEAQEGKSREIGFSAGYGTYEGAIGSILLSNRNLFQRAIQGSVELSVSERSLGLETVLVDPWLFETRTEFSTRVFLRNRIELGYEKREAGVRGELSRKLVPTFQLAAFGQIRTIEISSAQVDPLFLGNTSYQIGTVGFSATLDRRDNAINPGSGWIAAAVMDSNTLSQGNTFTRTSGRFTWHYPLPGRVRIAASGRFGILSQQSSVPIDERYFLGGANTVRSFPERKLGTKDSQGFPVGGTAYTLFNAEADFPLWQNLRGAAFFDLGSLTPIGEHPVNADYRSALGLGIRYALPVGPLRVDVGFNPDRRQNEPWGAAHLSFGFAF